MRATGQRPKKTLEQAIGCWTVNEDYNVLPAMGKMILKTCKRARAITKRGNAKQLKAELFVLRKRLITTLDLCKDAERRLTEIIETKELEKDSI